MLTLKLVAFCCNIGLDDAFLTIIKSYLVMTIVGLENGVKAPNRVFQTNIITGITTISKWINTNALQSTN